MSHAPGRLPAATCPGPVRLQVSSLERSLAFYGFLGLRTLDRAGAEARLGSDGGEPLVELVERSRAAPPPVSRLGLFHYAILLPDRGALGRFYAHLQEHGVRPGASDHLVSEALYLADPDGLGIEVYADRPRGAWRWRGDELAMDTLPLDVRDLVRAGGGGRWEGMPEGTAMGHLHLHVGDVEAAEAFYGGALGLEATVRGYRGALFLSAGGYHHHLGLNTWAGPRAVPAREEEPQLLEWRLDAPTAGDAEAAAARLEAAGQAVRRDAAGFTAADPWGTVLRVRAAG